jgi:hypothetical protein
VNGNAVILIRIACIVLDGDNAVSVGNTINVGKIDLNAGSVITEA